MSELSLENLCRLCLKESFLHANIFVDRVPNSSLIYEVLNFVYVLEISIDDGLSPNICRPCFWKLREFEIYKINVHQAKSELWKLKGKERENSVKQEPEEVVITAERNENSDEIEREGYEASPDVPKEETKTVEEETAAAASTPEEIAESIVTEKSEDGGVGYEKSNEIPLNTVKMEFEEDYIHSQKQEFSSDFTAIGDNTGIAMECLENVVKKETQPMEDANALIMQKRKSDHSVAECFPQTSKRKRNVDCARHEVEQNRVPFQYVDEYGAQQEKVTLKAGVEGDEYFCDVEEDVVFDFDDRRDEKKVEEEDDDNSDESGRDEEVTSPSSSTSYDQLPLKKPTMAQKKMAVDLWRSGRKGPLKLETVQHNFRFITNRMQLYRYEKQIIEAEAMKRKHAIKSASEKRGSECENIEMVASKVADQYNIGENEAGNSRSKEMEEENEQLRRIRVVTRANEETCLISERGDGIRCHYCRGWWETKEEMVAHIQMVHGFTCREIEGDPRNEGDFGEHSRVSSGIKIHTCRICYKGFASNSMLIKHIRIHTGEKPFQCSICGFKCSQNGHLKQHLRAHRGDKPHKCSICDYKCLDGGYLKVHMRIHSGEKPYQCSFCNIRFARKGTLTQHIRIHTGEKRYKCSLCDKKFSESGQLKNHIRTHTGEKPFKCSICDYKCSRSGGLKSHMKTHER